MDWLADAAAVLGTPLLSRPVTLRASGGDVTGDIAAQTASTRRVLLQVELRRGATRASAAAIDLRAVVLDASPAACSWAFAATLGEVELKSKVSRWGGVAYVERWR
jgi:hypothetical protein